MTPAEELLAAADRVEAWGEDATPGPWRVGRGSRHITASNERVSTVINIRDAVWIAGMGPQHAPHLAKWLRAVALVAGKPVTGLPVVSDTHVDSFDLGAVVDAAIALARSINGSAT